MAPPLRALQQDPGRVVIRYRTTRLAMTTETDRRSEHDAGGHHGSDYTWPVARRASGNRQLARSSRPLPRAWDRVQYADDADHARPVERGRRYTFR
jgi:hypothetical protein